MTLKKEVEKEVLKYKDNYSKKLLVSKAVDLTIKRVEETIDKKIPTNWLDPLLQEILDKKEFLTKDIERLLLRIKKELKKELSK